MVISRVSHVAGKSEVSGRRIVQSGVGKHRAECRRTTGKQYLAVREQGRRASLKAICACKAESVGCRIEKLPNVRGNMLTISFIVVGATCDQDSPIGEQSWSRKLLCGARVGVRAGGSECAGSRIIEFSVGGNPRVCPHQAYSFA